MLETREHGEHGSLSGAASKVVYNIFMDSVCRSTEIVDSCPAPRAPKFGNQLDDFPLPCIKNYATNYMSCFSRVKGYKSLNPCPAPAHQNIYDSSSMSRPRALEADQ